MNTLWIFILAMLSSTGTPLPVQRFQSEYVPVRPQENIASEEPMKEIQINQKEHEQDGEVISVRITSSVAVNRGNARPHHSEYVKKINKPVSNFTLVTEPRSTEINVVSDAVTENTLSTLNAELEAAMPADIKEEKPQTQKLEGANMEFIKQLKTKKESRGLSRLEGILPYTEYNIKTNNNESNDSFGVESSKSILEIPLENNDGIYNKNVPIARSVPFDPSHKNYIQDLPNKSFVNIKKGPKLTTAVSFNIIHNTPKSTIAVAQPSDTNLDQNKSYSVPEKMYSEPPKIYSQPAKIYSEPAKFYSEPAKIYSEPAKIYSEPAKIYSEPAKIYSEPAKFYSQPASLNLPPAHPPVSWQNHKAKTVENTESNSTTILDPKSNVTSTDSHTDLQPEKNYEVDEKVSVMTDGKRHGVQDNTENCKQDNCKVGYVVEGRQYRKYRVEERTPDGFIVGEYGVVRNEDGDLRGVRYTADSDASPRLIYDALMKFLQL